MHELVPRVRNTPNIFYLRKNYKRPFNNGDLGSIFDNYNIIVKNSHNALITDEPRFHYKPYVYHTKVQFAMEIRLKNILFVSDVVALTEGSSQKAQDNNTRTSFVCSCK